MLIWVTGCAGFLGSRLIPVLKKKENKIIGFSRMYSPAPDISISADLAGPSAVNQMIHTIKKFGKPSVILHLASRQPAKIEISRYVHANTLTTANLIEAIQNNPPEMLIYTSTLSVYGKPDGNPVNEGHKTNCDTPYALTKLAGEVLLKCLKNLAKVLVLRLPSLYGAGQADSFVDGLANLALEGKPIELYNKGEVIRDALHVSDVTKMMEVCIRKRHEPDYSIYNLGCGQPLTSYDYAKTIVEATGSDSQLIPVEKRSPQNYDLYADISKARTSLDFTPLPLSESIRKYINEIQTQP